MELHILTGLIFVILCSSFGKDFRTDALSTKFRQIFSWKYLDFDYLDDVARTTAIELKEFIPGAPLPIDVETYYRPNSVPKIFVTIPRFQEGIPVTLGYVTSKLADDNSPLIAPYPSWDWHRVGNCDGITSVFRIQIDPCGRLWVLDTGKIEEQQICHPQLLAFSLSTDELLVRHQFPEDQLKRHSLLVTPIVDVRDPHDQCQDTFVYVADVTGFSLLVYDHANSRSWHINNNLFYPYPPHGTFNIQGHTFDLMDGLLGLALSPLKPNEDRILYFHSLASTVESYVSTAVIRNHSIFHDNPDAAARAFRSFPKERSSQAAAEVMDRDGILFFGMMSELAIGCWNSVNYDYGKKHIKVIAEDLETLQFASGLKIVTSKSGAQELWVLTASFQRFMTGSLSPNETNFRIQAGFVEELVRGTMCDVASININNVFESVSSSTSKLTFPK